jgi:hypothetical protein
MNPALRYVGEFAEELILLGMIILNVLEFFELLSPDWNYVEKLISITALVYLLYKVSLTKIFFGTQNRHLDFTILVAYCFLSFKVFLSYSRAAIAELTEKGTSYWAHLEPVSASPRSVIHISSPLSNVSLEGMTNIPVGESLDNLSRSFTINLTELPPRVNEVYVNISNDVSSRIFLLEPRFLIHRWHNLLIDHGALLTKIGIVAGLILLLCITWYYTRRIPITKPSMMHVIQEEGPPPATFSGSVVRFLIVFAVLNFFFIAVFNSTMEWLAIAVDAPLLVLVVFFYLLVWLKHHKRFDPESLIYQIGNFGEDFFESFVELFHSQRGILLAVSGMLVLHLLTDIGNFLIPYMTGLSNAMYIGPLGAGHAPVFAASDLFSGARVGLLMQDLARSLSVVDTVSIVFLYALNCIAFLMLFIGPAVIWYVIFKQKETTVSNGILAVFYGAIAVLLLAPVFHMQRIESDALVGVDITTSLLPASIPPLLIVIIALVIGAAVLVLSNLERIKGIIILGGVGIVMLYFALYIFYFFIDTGSYYVTTIVASLQTGNIIIGLYFLMFLALTIIFYIGGWLVYVYELLKS